MADSRGHALGAAMLGMLLDGYDLSIMAVVLLPLSSAWHLQATETGILMAMALLGSLIGGLFGGFFTDRFGRRRLLFPNIFLYVLGALISAFSPDTAALFAGRFITGLAIGLDYPLVATIVAEYSQSAQRGNRFARVNLAWYIGALLSTLVGWALLSTGPDSWRWMLGSAIVPALALLWLRRGLPESPRWLVRKGQHQQAEEALVQLQPAYSPAQRQAELESFQIQRQSWRILLRKAWLRRLFLSVFPWFCLDVVGLGIGLYFPMVLRDNGLASSNAAAAAINAAFLIISALGIVFIVSRLDRWGRIPLQSAGFALMSLGLAVFALCSWNHWIMGVYLAAAVYSFGVGIGPGVTVFALAVEIFPTELRASAAGLATALSRLGAFFSAVLFPIFEKSWGIPLVLVFMSVVALLGLLATLIYGVESRMKSLEELENLAAKN
ncbi:sugar porter family MFS transporter [Acidithiobacillus thiooxidans]|uniref:MFS transporter n=1 Tax=Acidithiobacillus TaxID=119977 RepID=UPI001879ECD6|nr:MULTISPECIES: MFS transporter [Acidithiobacillus]MBE7567147.1 MFS transporter [Acidithiobacillus sp. HP-11]MBU2752584.1 sugar porter family MFS transporter [Acidithiobacillus thiooxidans]MBU2792287.1 sugar porter family MFS transporter [Acidithiobacillus thiooxidans]